MGDGSPDINRRFTPIIADYFPAILVKKILNRRLTQIHTDDDSPQRRRGRREWLFCLSGDYDKQKHVSIADNNRIIILKLVLNRRLTQINADKDSEILPQRRPSMDSGW